MIVAVRQLAWLIEKPAILSQVLVPTRGTLLPKKLASMAGSKQCLSLDV